MALLAGVHYDPGTAATAATTSLLAMTAIDTTNLRVTFTAPPSGNVLVRLRCSVTGNSSSPNILLGVLEGSTVIGRQAPICAAMAGSASTRNMNEAQFVVTGLSGSHTWDAAYAVQLVQTTSQIEWGGPDDTTTNNAWGGFSFEVWEATNLLAGTLYDPGTAVSAATSALLAVTAFDTTNLRLSFLAPTNGRVLVKMRTLLTGSATAAGILHGVLEGATVVARCSPVGGRTTISALAAGSWIVQEGTMLVTGLTPGLHTYDAAYGVEIATASTNAKYGGPNDAAGADAWGGFAYEIWNAG